MEDYPSHRVLGSSFLSLLTAGFAAWRGLYGCATLVFIVFVTSVCYWWNPVKGARRNVDIAAVTTCLAYQSCVSFRSSTQTGYFLCIAVGLSAYAASRRATDVDTASMLHVFRHVMGNAANVVLYVGL